METNTPIWFKQNINREKVYEVLKYEVERSGVKAVSKRLGVSRDVIFNFLKGRTDISDNVLTKLETVYGIPRSYFDLFSAKFLIAVLLLKYRKTRRLPEKCELPVCLKHIYKRYNIRKIKILLSELLQNEVVYELYEISDQKLLNILRYKYYMTGKSPTEPEIKEAPTICIRFKHYDVSMYTKNNVVGGWNKAKILARVPLNDRGVKGKYE